MSLTQELQDVAARAEKRIPPEVLKSLQKSIDDLERSGMAQRALEAGDLAPAFTLPNAQGRPIALMDLLQRGAVIVSFYRGLWCPYCNVELRAYQRVMPEIRALGATLVAISPQTSERSDATATQNGLEFEVLSDHRNEVAAHYGVAYDVPEAVRTITEKFGHHLPDYNGSDDWQLPISATYVIVQSQRIILSDVDPDFRRRLDPNDVLTALRRHAEERKVA